jgi:SAM-dependent methyltransferase
MFKELERINERPAPFQYYTAAELWTNEHTSKMMLEFHLNEAIDVSSRNIKFIKRSVDWISARFGVDETKHICDFGCGPGLYTTRLAERGAKVTGIDFSGRSIDYAKKVAVEKGLGIDYVHQNYLGFESDQRFDLITMIMCDFCALSPAQRRELLTKFRTLLKPNGSVLLDVYSLEAFNGRAEQTVYEVNLLNGFWSPKKYYGFLNTFKYDDEKVVLDKYTIVEPGRTREVYNWLQYFSQESLIEEFESNGFKIENIYSDVAGSEYDPHGIEMAVIAKKAI